jgi:hypothetical protein
MKLFDLAALARRAPEGEYVLGAQDLATHACYLIYGVVEPGAAPRRLCPGPGHEEIVCVVSGRLRLEGRAEVRAEEVAAGQAFHLRGEEELRASAEGAGPAGYVICGGHTPGARHDHP